MPGPNPTFDEVIDAQLGPVVNLVDALYNFGGATTPNLLDRYDAVATVVDGYYTPQLATGSAGLIAAVSAQLSPESLQALFRPAIDELIRVIDKPTQVSNDVEKLSLIRQYMVDNSQSLLRRGMTFSQPVDVGTPTFTGDWRRISVDKDGNTLDACNPETLTFKVEQDETSGADGPHAEVWRVTGQTPGQHLYWTGSGIDFTTVSRHAGSTPIIKNPSFDNNGGSADNVAPASTTAVDGWVIAGAASNLRCRSNSSYVYRNYPAGPTTPYGLEFVASDTISQTIRTTTQGAAFQLGVPYFCRVAVKRLADATGTVTLHLGSQTAAVDLSTLTTGVWSHLYIALGTGCYYENFKELDLDVKIVVATLAVGTVAVDDLLLIPFERIGGNFYVFDGGATPGLKGDAQTAATTDGGTRAKHGYWLWRAWGEDGWLANAAAGNTVANPA